MLRGHSSEYSIFLLNLMSSMLCKFCSAWDYVHKSLTTHPFHLIQIHLQRDKLRNMCKYTQRESLHLFIYTPSMTAMSPSFLLCSFLFVLSGLDTRFIFHYVFSEILWHSPLLSVFYLLSVLCCIFYLQWWQVNVQLPCRICVTQQTCRHHTSQQLEEFNIHFSPDSCKYPFYIVTFVF